MATTAPKPRKLKKADKANLSTLLRAADNRDLAIVSAVRKSDNKSVALLCAMQVNADQTITPMPLAVMIEGNPFEDYYDPMA